MHDKFASTYSLAIIFFIPVNPITFEKKRLDDWIYGAFSPANLKSNDWS